MKKQGPTLQPYPREGNTLLASSKLFPIKHPPLDEKVVDKSIDDAFNRCIKDKKGSKKSIIFSPEQLVSMTLKHLKERSDPILNPYFVSLFKAEHLFEYDAISYEMQRNRMSIGLFYQFLILELMKHSWSVFDASREGDIVAEIDNEYFDKGLRIYMSVKKSSDTVGGQDIGGVISRLEKTAKDEKNLTRPYLCVVCFATPSKGKIQSYNEDRGIRCKSDGQPYSQNCEIWGPGFIYPYISGFNASEIYLRSIKRVSNYIPFLTIEYREKCSILLQKELLKLDLLNKDNTINPEKFLRYIIGDNLCKRKD